MQRIASMVAATTRKIVRKELKKAKKDIIRGVMKKNAMPKM